ncbi:MAG TPA: ClpXP protease specificity-enhancing factor SspB [Xanthobacteraceae bacterium]|nr:ClpXP protease specificity-enhancing factor SspB [Xanthobacteraceae bacterium]
MAVDYIRYDILAQDALRGVVRTVLMDAAKKGLPGDHHFYITFDTRAEGVRLSQRMLAQYPEEMTVVLQHQFWDLVVSEEDFEVGLSFGGVPERLAVPFTSIKAFVDPAVQFALQFEEIGGEAESESSEQEGAAAAAQKGRGKEPARPPAEHKGGAPIAAVPTPANPPAPTDGAEPNKPTSGEVVRLDRFRKK